MKHNNQLNSADLGDRLRLARETASFTQAKAAEEIGIARTTLVAIEQGQRQLKMQELQKFAELYGTSANSLLREEAVYVDIVPRFRKMPSSLPGAVDEASKLFAELLKAEVELDNLLGVQARMNLPPERPILPGNVSKQAESDALELRQRMGIGLQPILDINTLLELEFGVRLYVRRLNGNISGLFTFDEKLGACILLNANHPRERRNYTAAHELGHLISARNKTDVLFSFSKDKAPEEKYADAFARSFLMPTRTVNERLKDLTAGPGPFTRRHVIQLAYAFGVSREAMVRRLEELELVKEGAWDWFEANGGITDEQAREVLGDLIHVDTEKINANRPIMFRLCNKAIEAWRRSLLSEGQLSRLLGLNRIELRKMLFDSGTEGKEDNNVPMLLL